MSDPTKVPARLPPGIPSRLVFGRDALDAVNSSITSVEASRSLIGFPDGIACVLSSAVEPGDCWAEYDRPNGMHEWVLVFRLRAPVQEAP